MMVKIMHVQTVLMAEELEALKEKTGESCTKDALARAVEHFLECDYAHRADAWARKLEMVVQKRAKSQEEQELHEFGMKL